MLHSRWRRATMAAVASLCASAAIVPAAIAAPGDLPDLVQSIPSAPAVNPDPDTNQVNWGGFFDDHSIGGDDHMGWCTAAPIHEALKVSFQSVITNNGNGALEVCGYPSGSPNWLRAYQTTPGDLGACPATRRAAPRRTGSATPSPTTRPPASSTAGTSWTSSASRSSRSTRPSGTRTQWDTRWGTCMNDNQYMDCEHAAGATNLVTGIAPHTSKVTQEGAPDQTVVAFPNRVPNGPTSSSRSSTPTGRSARPAPATAASPASRST